MRNSALQDQFRAEREELRQRIGDSLATKMAALLNEKQTADLLLVSADGHRIPAHLCILRRRAAVFCQRYVEPTLTAAHRPTAGRPLEVAVGDVDSAGLSFFIRSVYTDEEIAQLPTEEFSSRHRKEDRDGGGGPPARRRDGNGPLSPSKRGGYRDGLSDDVARDSPTPSGRSRKEAPKDTTTSSNSHLSDLTNRFPEAESEGLMPVGMSASFPSPDDLQKRLPVMTSFAELASQASLEYGADSPMCLSVCSESDSRRRSRSVTSEVAGSCKFIRLDESVASQSSSRSESRTRNHSQSKSFFYTIGPEEDAMTQSAPSNDVGSIRARALLARRLSVSSLTSLTSIDLTPTHEGPPPPPDRLPASRLGEDLLSLYLDGKDADITVKTQDEKLRAHRCVLWATCPAFRPQLATGKVVDLSGYSQACVHFLLSFLYGGLTCVAEDVDIWELTRLAEELQLDELTDVVVLNLRSYRYHFFHRPCASCVSAIFDALPQLHEFPSLKPLREEALGWQARHFARIWKGRVFLHLAEPLQRECFDALLAAVNEETVVDVLLGCEKLQVALPRLKSQHASQFVQRLVQEIIDFSTELLISAFDGVIASKSFVQQGRGLALNLALLEDILPTLVHSLNADTAIRSFICLKQLLAEIAEAGENSRSHSGSSRNISGSSFSLNQSEEFNSRFVHLCRRLFDLADKHLLHYAASVVHSESWSLLTPAEQSRIETEGIYVEFRQPRAPPPRFSSFNRAYKRSSSVGFSHALGGGFDRSRSLERARPLETFARLLEADEPMEAILEREKSQTQIQLHRRTASTPSGAECAGAKAKAADPSKIPAVKTKRAEPAEAREPPAKPPATSPTPSGSRSPVKKVADSSRPQPTRPVGAKKAAVPSPTRRQPARHPPPVAQHRPLPPPGAEGSVNLERQDTMTIMTAAQHKERGVEPKHLPEVFNSTETLVITSPTPTPSAAGAKPRSVVRPMVKTVATPTAQARKSTATTPTSSSAAKTTVRSSLPTRRTSPNPPARTAAPPLSIDGRPRRSEGTRIPQSPGKRRRAK